MSSHKRWVSRKRASLRTLEDMFQSAHGYRLAIQDCLKDIREMRAAVNKIHGGKYLDALEDVEYQLEDTLEQVERTLDQLNEQITRQLANERPPL